MKVEGKKVEAGKGKGGSTMQTVWWKTSLNSAVVYRKQETCWKTDKHGDR